MRCLMRQSRTTIKEDKRTNAPLPVVAASAILCTLGNTPYGVDYKQ
jgi:hypothetical protein